jgi:hypothetical protein
MDKATEAKDVFIIHLRASSLLVWLQRDGSPPRVRQDAGYGIASP